MQAPQAHRFKISYRRHVFKNSEEDGYVKSQTEKGYLLKYYPKYYMKLDLKKIDRPTALKIKGIKRLHHVTGVLEKSQPSSLGTILVQKVWKDFRSPPILYRGKERELIEEKRWYSKGCKEIKQLAGLEKINVPRGFLIDPFKSQEGNLRNSNGNVNRILTYLAYNEKLRRVEAGINGYFSDFIESKLKRCKKLREKFNVGLFILYDFDISDSHIKNSVISQNITLLDVRLCQIGILKDIATLVGVFQSLRVIRIIPNWLVSPCKLSDTELHQMTLNFYKSIEKLPSLEKLSLGFTGDGLAWIKNFALPKSLRILKVSFLTSKKLFPLLESQDTDSQSALILKSFSSRIQELPLLDTLRLYVSGSSGGPLPVLDYVCDLLRGIPRLSSLKLDLPSGYSGSENSNAPLDFSLIFEGIQHLMPLLRGLKIGFGSDIDFNSVTFSPSPKYKFPNLRELCIIGRIDFLFNLREALMMVSDCRPFSKMQQRLEIQSLTIHKLALNRLLMELQEMGPSESHIELKLNLQFLSFDQKDLENMVEIFVGFIKNGRYIKGLALRILTKKPPRLEDIFKAFQKNPIVENFEIVILNSDEDEVCWYKFKKGALVQKRGGSEEAEENN